MCTLMILTLLAVTMVTALSLRVTGGLGIQKGVEDGESPSARKLQTVGSALKQLPIDS